MSRTRSEGGFSLVSAIFLLVVMTSAAAVVVNVSGVERSTTVLSLNGARGWEAARAGIEWGISRLQIDSGCGAWPNPANFNLGQFQISVVCTADSHTEGAQPVNLFILTSTATYGTFPSPDYIQRTLQATVNP